MTLFLTGINHKTAPVSIREKISFRTEDLSRALQSIRRGKEIRESVILSTCNRTEIYAVSESENYGFIHNYLSEFHKIPPHDFINHLYTKKGLDVARHLFLVTGGLDSLVLGEDQILGQIKQFYRIAQEERSLGTLLHRLFQSALEAGKRIRHETALGENPGSIGEAAVDLAKQIFGNLQDKTILILGAGVMGREVIDTLLEKEVARIKVCSRTFESAKALAEEFHGEACPIEKLDQSLAVSDIVIAATDSPTPILTKIQLEQVMRERRNAPLFVIDIAVPRDVEESAGQLENLFLYNVDDLKQIVEKSNHVLQKELVKAESILEEELTKFQAWQDSRHVIPTIKQLTEKMEEIKRAEIQKMFSKFPELNEKQRTAIETLGHSLINKALHRPLIQLKDYANHPLGTDYLEMIRELYGLDE